jgi:glycosyltransferase involved in cell wall biosynthesis
MKIGLITVAMDEKRAGIARYCYNLIKNLKKIDNKNEYILIHRKKTSEEGSHLNRELIIPYPRVPLKRTIGNYLQLPLKLKKESFDLIHDPSQISPFLFSFPSLKVLTIHDLSPILFPETYGMIHVFLQKYILPKSLKNVDKVIAVSESTKRDIVKYLGFPEEDIKVIYNGVEERFKPLDQDLCSHEYTPYILFVGTLEPRKNITTLLKAFYILKKKGIKHKLVIVGGKGWKYRKIYEVVKKLNLSENVKFLGHVADDELPKLYSGADLFVYPSLYEGFGLPPLEAMACGCPVITSNVSSLPEVVGDAGIMVDPLDKNGLADAIYKVLNDEGLREEMVKRGLKRVKIFSWEICAKETLKVYREVVKYVL